MARRSKAPKVARETYRYWHISGVVTRHPCSCEGLNFCDVCAPPSKNVDGYTPMYRVDYACGDVALQGLVPYYGYDMPAYPRCV